MKTRKEIDHLNDYDFSKVTSENYQIEGIRYFAQKLTDRTFNDCRNDFEALAPEKRKELYLNGERSRSYDTFYGKNEIAVSILRGQSVELPTIGKWKRTSPEVEIFVYDNFLNGESCRQIERQTTDYGFPISRSKVSRINKKYREGLEEFKRQDLSKKDYTYVSFDAFYESTLTCDPDNNEYKSIAYLRAVGINAETGYAELIDIKGYESESIESYTDFLTGLKRRGLNNFMLCLQDFHEGLDKALQKVYPLIFHIYCFFHFLQLVFKKLPKNVEDGVVDRIADIAYEKNPLEMKKKLKDFKDSYEESYSDAFNCLKRHAEDCMVWSTFESEVKTNNINERANREDRRLVDRKGNFKSVESGEAIMIANSLNYFSNTKTKKQYDPEMLKSLKGRYKEITGLIKQDVLESFLESGLPESPPEFSTPVAWIDVLDVPYRFYGMETTVKIVVFYGLKKARRKRLLLWACPLFEASPERLEDMLELIKQACLKDPVVIILPADDPILLEAVKNVFRKSSIQVDLRSFMNVMNSILPVNYREAFKACFKSAFENDSQKGATGEILKLIEESLFHHNLEKALEKYLYFKEYLLTLLDIGINSFFNFGSTECFKSHLLPKREDGESNKAFFGKTLDTIRFYTWCVPCVYQDEIKALFTEF